MDVTLTPRGSRRHPAAALTDLDYAGDVSLASDNVEQAQELLNRVESECAEKTEFITCNVVPEHPPVTIMGGTDGAEGSQGTSSTNTQASDSCMCPILTHVDVLKE